MKRFKILFILLLIVKSIFCQDSTSTFSQATFDGNFSQYFGELINFPTNLVKDGAQSYTKIGFYIDANGHIDSIDVLEYPNILIAQEAAQLLNSTANMWKPTMLNHKPIPYTYQLIVKYEYFESTPPTKEKSAELYDKSYKKFDKEKYDDALDLINKAILLDPYYSRYYDLRSKIFNALNDSENAEIDNKKYLYMEKSIIAVIHQIGYSYVTRTPL